MLLWEGLSSLVYEGGGVNVTGSPLMSIARFPNFLIPLAEELADEHGDAAGESGDHRSRVHGGPDLADLGGGGAGAGGKPPPFPGDPCRGGIDPLHRFHHPAGGAPGGHLGG